MMIDKRPLFTTIEHIWALKMISDLPPLEHYKDWIIKIYASLLMNIKKNPDLMDSAYTQEIICNLQCDIINVYMESHPKNGKWYFCSPHYNQATNKLFYKLWDDPKHYWLNVENTLDTDDLISTFNVIYDNDHDISIFDFVELNDPLSKNHGNLYIVVGISEEDETTLFKCYGLDADFSFGYTEAENLVKVV